MYATGKKSRAAAQRSLERRSREDAAPRLAAEVPGLMQLQIAVSEHSPLGTTRHVRHVVVANAPALFVIPCGDPSCADGGHDVTAEVMSSLRQHLATWAGEHACGGMTGSASCPRRIHFELAASYR